MLAALAMVAVGALLVLFWLDVRESRAEQDGRTRRTTSTLRRERRRERVRRKAELDIAPAIERARVREIEEHVN